MRNTLKKTLAGASAAALLLGPLMVFAAPDGPTVTLSSSASFTAAAPTNVTWVTPIPVTVTVSSSTTEFDAADVSVVGAMGVENFSGSGTSYSFTVKPGDGDPLHDSQPRYVRIEVNADKFGGNQASNAIEFWFDPAAMPVDNTAPTITFNDPSPAEGATIYTADNTATTTGFTFAFSTNDASSTLMCSIVGSSNADSFYSCGSPQAFSGFGVGTYRFAVKATDPANNVATSSRTFTIAVSTSSPASTSTPTTGGGSSGSSGGSSGGSSSGGGGNGMIIGSSPIGPQAAGGMNWGVNPNQVVVRVPSAENPSPDVFVAPAPQAAAPTQSQTTPAATPVARMIPSSSSQRTSPSSAPVVENASTTSPIFETPTPTPTEQNLQGAAAATAPAVPTAVWVWSLIGIGLIALLGWLFYRPA